MQAFVTEHAALKCSLRVLPADRSLADVWASGLLQPSQGTAVLALDFDQTLTLVRPNADGVRQKGLRGGEPARAALHAMRDAGVRMVVVTAQSPSVGTVENMAKELGELGLAELFDARPAEPETSLEELRRRYEVTFDGGVKLAIKGHTVAARYNKPEGLQAWMDREGLAPDKLVFVDDNSDNAFSMFLHFATLEKQHAKEGGAAKPVPPSTCSIWYPPESASTEENFDKTTRQLLLRLSRGRLGGEGEAAELD
jgi:hypothetical protein